MNIDRIIGRGLMAAGAVAASFSWIQLLFQKDSSALPVEMGLPTAIMAVVGGAAAVQIGKRMVSREG
jgi:TRAP-type C4-dicarboxylate transport system permease small subunit